MPLRRKRKEGVTLRGQMGKWKCRKRKNESESDLDTFHGLCPTEKMGRINVNAEKSEYNLKYKPITMRDKLQA